MKRWTFFVITLLFSFGSVAAFLEKEWQEAYHGEFKVSASTKSSGASVQYPYTRLARAGAPVVVLVHGIGGNHHNWMDFGPALYRMGYEVWAFRWSIPHDRDLDELAHEALPQMLELASSTTGQTPYLIGHSLGGIISKIYLFGLKRKGKGYIIDEKAKKRAAQSVKAFVSLASPNGRENESLESFMPLFENLPTSTIYGLGDLTSTIKKDRLTLEKVIVKTLEFNSWSLRLPILNRFMNIVFHMPYHDHSDYNVGSLVRFGISAIPTGVRRQIRELGKEIREGDASLSAVLFNEERLIPFAYVAGENDPIANASSISKEAAAQKAPYLELPEGGHLDPLFGDMKYETLLFVNNFFMNAL